MAAITADRLSPGAAPPGGAGPAWPGTLRSEFTKLRSVRSTYWTLLLLVLAGHRLVASRTARARPRTGRTRHLGSGGFFDATQDSIVGLALLGQLVVVVLGSLAITSEYSTGMIRTSLTVHAQARRGVRAPRPPCSPRSPWSSRC